MDDDRDPLLDPEASDEDENLEKEDAPFELDEDGNSIVDDDEESLDNFKVEGEEEEEI